MSDEARFQVILDAIEDSTRVRAFTFNELMNLKVSISKQLQPHIDAAYRAEAGLPTRADLGG